MKTIPRVAMFLVLGLASALASARTIIVEVNGLVCAFCAQGIEKSMKKFEAVEAVFVSLEHRMVAIALRPSGDIRDAKLKAALTRAGYTVVGIKRSEESLASIRQRTKARRRS